MKESKEEDDFSHCQHVLVVIKYLRLNERKDQGFIHSLKLHKTYHSIYHVFILVKSHTHTCSKNSLYAFLTGEE